LEPVLEPALEQATPSRSASIPSTVAPHEPVDVAPDDDFPVLTDAVEAFEAMPAPAPGADDALAGERSADEGEPSEWFEHPDESPSIIDEAPDSIAVVPPIERDVAADKAQAAAPVGDAVTGTAHLVDVMIAAAPSPDAQIVAELSTHAAPALSALEAGTPESAHSAIGIGSVPAVTALPDVATQGMSPAAVEARWQAMAEEIRAQVLQRIDLFTDTGLHEQLGERLQPIVDRAGADLVNTINQHVGEILRSYVSEAIEREIEHWRADR
jgi:hypothetical protein